MIENNYFEFKIVSKVPNVMNVSEVMIAVGTLRKILQVWSKETSPETKKKIGLLCYFWTDSALVGMIDHISVMKREDIGDTLKVLTYALANITFFEKV
jgi:hypothetical protein